MPAFKIQARDAAFENLSFSPHSLAAQWPLGGISRARLIVYGALSSLRHRENSFVEAEPDSVKTIAWNGTAPGLAVASQPT